MSTCGSRKSVPCTFLSWRPPQLLSPVSFETGFLIGSPIHSLSIAGSFRGGWDTTSCFKLCPRCLPCCDGSWSATVSRTNPFPLQVVCARISYHSDRSKLCQKLSNREALSVKQGSVWACHLFFSQAPSPIHILKQRKGGGETRKIVILQ